MTLDELDAVYRQAAWLITKRSGMTALKALTLGTEALEKTVSEIADLYDLTGEERVRLKPVIAGDIQGGLATAVTVARTAAGFPMPIADASSAPSHATEQGHLATAAMALVTIGPKAAKAHPVIAAASVAYAVGSAGWFGYHAQAYNRAAYELVRGKFGAGAPEPGRVGQMFRAAREGADNRVGRLKQFVKRKAAPGEAEVPE